MSCKYRIMPFRRRKVLFPTTRKSHSKKLEPDRLVRIWPRQGHEYSTYHALIDTGADENLILRSAVQDLDLAIEQTESFTLQTVQDLSFVVSEHVQPKWQFQDGKRQHTEYPFYVVDRLPCDIDMILGNITRKGLGIHLRAPRNALIAYEDLKGSFNSSLSRVTSLTNSWNRSFHSRPATAEACKTES